MEIHMSPINRVTLTATTAFLAATLFPPASAQSKADANSSLAARVQRLEDLEEIRALLIDYGRFLDARDFQSYSQLFAKDGEWIGGLGKVQGPAAIQAFMEKNIGTTNTAHNYHLLSNFEIEVHGDTATAWSRWAFVVPGPDKKPVIAQGGRYDDTLVRENGHWKFKRRTASNDLPSSGLVQTK
jgi:ketosteroid isomerase-like protein